MNNLLEFPKFAFFPEEEINFICATCGGSGFSIDVKKEGLDITALSLENIVRIICLTCGAFTEYIDLEE